MPTSVVVKYMNVLETARKTLARLKAQRNGHCGGPHSPCTVPGYDINDLDDKSQKHGGFADIANPPVTTKAPLAGAADLQDGYDRNDKNDQSPYLLVGTPWALRRCGWRSGRAV
jgi:hypothetical protein